MSVILALPVLLVVVAIVAVFLAIGAKVAGIDGRSYGKAFMATGIDVVISWILAAGLGLIGLGNGLIAFVVGLAVNLYIIKSIYTTGWGRAFVAWLVQVIAIVVFIGVPLFFLVGLAALSSFGR